MSIIGTAVAKVKQAAKSLFSDSKPQWNEELADFVNKEFERRQAERRPFELQWRLNRAFVDGNQYVDINTATGTVDEVPKLYWWQEREVFNHIAPIVDTRHARLNRQRPVLKVRPASGEQRDIGAAKTSSKILTGTYHDLNMRSIMTEATAWSESGVDVLLKHAWNPNKGRVVAKAAATDEEGSLVEQEIRDGDIEVTVVPGDEVYPDSSWHKLPQCRSVIHAKAYPVAQIKEMWGVEVAPEQVDAITLQRNSVGSGGLGYAGGTWRAASAKLKDHAVVKEYWERPSQEYPEGRFIVVAGKQTVHSGPLPYAIGDDGTPDFPFTKIDSITRPGCFWQKSVVERCIPLQRRYNAIKNRKAEYLSRVAIGQIAVEDGSVDIDDLEEDGASPGKIIVYQKGSQLPAYMQNPPLPATFEVEEAKILQDFSTISGVSEITRQSQAPPGLKSGVALSIAVEQDDTRLSSAAANIEMALIDSGKKWLRLYKQFVQGPRIVRYVGKDNEVDVIDWTASDIRSNDVVIEAGTALAESPAQRRQMVFDLLESGLFNDPETGRISKEGQRKVFELLEFGTWESFDDDDELHVSRADRENRLMLQGMVPEAAEYDDDIIHLARHNRYRLTSDYEEVVSLNPMISQAFEAHVAMHLGAVQQQMMEQAQAEQSQMTQALGGQFGAGEAAPVEGVVA